MSDPAVEATQRAYELGKFDPYGETMLLAAREALKPIRELHYPRPDSVSALFPTPLCNCGYDWPCETAPLAYAAEELVWTSASAS